MKKLLKPVLFGMAVTMGVSGFGLGGAHAAQSTSTLDWTYTLPADLDMDYGILNSGTFSGDNLYVWVLKQGADGRERVVQSFDQENGDKDNWTYAFQDSQDMLNSSGQVFGDKKGNSYFLTIAADGKYKLVSLNAEGKIRWQTPLGTGTVKQLYPLNNGDLVVSDSVQAKNAETVNVFSTYGSDGKLKNTKKVKASDLGSKDAMLSVLPDGRVQAKSQTKLQLFKSLNDLKKPVLTHNISQWTNIALNSRADQFGSAIFTLSGGQTLIRFDTTDMSAVSNTPNGQEVDSSKVKRTNSLVLFDAKGQKKWERALTPQQGLVPTADGFALQTGGKIELYGADNKLKNSKTVQGEDLWLAKAKTTDELTLTSGKSGLFMTLDPKDLSVKYELDLSAATETKAPYTFLYEGKGELYVHATDASGSKTVSHYKLK